MTYQLTVANIQMKPTRSAPDARGSGAAPSTPAAPAARSAAKEDAGDDDGDGDSDSRRSRKLFLRLDIETIPSQDPDLIEQIKSNNRPTFPDLDSIEAAANLVDERKISADLEKRRAKAISDYEGALKKADDAAEIEWRNTSKSGTHGHLACISFAAGDGKIHNVRNVCLDNLDEFELDFDAVRAGEMGMLADFFSMLDEVLDQEDARIHLEGGYHLNRDPIIVAHFADFDIRFIWQRAIAIGFPIPRWWPINYNKYRDDQVVDTMTMWAGHGNRISLDRLCKSLGIPGKGDGIDGSKVWDAIVDGRLYEVCMYCDDDIRRLRSCHRKMQGLAPLEGDVEQLNDDGGADDDLYERPRTSFLKPHFTFFDAEEGEGL
ncbi:hypothetical protein [Pelagibacterium sp.]|uniref:hypothetical protein n=1 Tax=Pelagibacterium sp. TaxID=1967288 RepID=UPI003A933C6E